jgi:prephenate dehydrogenase
MAFQQVTIVGTGLIGGSLGLAFKQHDLAARVVGCDRADVLDEARRLGAIDSGQTELKPACAGSDLIVLALPVGGIIDSIGRLADAVTENVLVTDVGSTKREICGAAMKVWGEKAAERFLPGHPMAGKAESGIANASAELFRGAPWLFTPLSQPLAPKASAFLSAIEQIGARPMMCDAAEHDRTCAYVSHLPQMLATALANVVDEMANTQPPAEQLAGAGLRSMTRLAASPYAMWRDIALTNADNLADAILKMEQKLAHLRENLKSPELRAEFERAQAARAMLK